MADAITENLVRLRRRAIVLRTSLENLEREVANNPDNPEWSNILHQYDTILRQMTSLREDIQPVLAHTLVYPCAMPANPQDIPMFLSTRADLEMEQVEQEVRQREKAETSEDREAVVRYNSMLDRLEAIIHGFDDKRK